MTLGVNDYPWPHADCSATNWNLCGYTYRQCVDFTMWRMHHDLGQPCRYWGNGADWAQRARADGVGVDSVPRLHDIAQFDPGIQGASGSGHVAFVLGIGNGTIDVEEYNFGNACGYSRRTVAVGGVNFIHVAPVPTPPPPVPVPVPTPQPVCPDGWELSNDGLTCLYPVGALPTGGSGVALLPLALLGAAGGLAWYAYTHPGAGFADLRRDVTARAPAVLHGSPRAFRG